MSSTPTEWHMRRTCRQLLRRHRVDDGAVTGDEPDRGALANLHRLAGFLAVFVSGGVVLYAIPVVFPDDNNEPAAALTVLVVLTLVTTSIVVVLRHTRRAPQLASGVLAGFAAWVVMFVVWAAAGP